MSETSSIFNTEAALSRVQTITTGLSVQAVIALVIFLAILIITGRILAKINASNCKEDEHIKEAKKWSAWSVGLSSTGLVLSLVVLVLALYFKFSKSKTE